MATALELEKKFRTCPFELKAMGTATGEAGQFSGLASVFYNVDYAGEIVAPDAFKAALPHFLSNGFLTYEHNWAEPIGKPVEAKETAEGLLVTGEIYPEMFNAQSVLAGMKRGVIKEMSIGFYVEEAQELTPEQLKSWWADKKYSPTPADLERARDGVRVLTKIRLEEAAICVRGANDQARVLGVKGVLETMLKRLFGNPGRKAVEVSIEAEDDMEDPEMDPSEAEAETEDPQMEQMVERLMAACKPAIKAELLAMAAEAEKGNSPTAIEETPAAGEKPAVDGKALKALFQAERLLIDIDVEQAMKEAI